MGRRRRQKGRDVHGILLLDKPLGVTSNEALQLVKRLFFAKKAGHTGSLDKMASGLLPVCFGEATKFSGFLLDANKHYIASCRLGVETSTGDVEGEVVNEFTVPDLKTTQIEKVLGKFRGKIMQTPPMFSALKHKGQRLYELAHQGIEVERQARQVTIFNLSLLNYSDASLEIDVLCSKGTYIRTLAEDIGKALGCGAHISSLRRTGAGPFDASQMHSMDDLRTMSEQGFEALDETLLAVDTALENLPSVSLLDEVADYLVDGQAVIVPKAPTSGLLRIYSQKNGFIGLGEVLDDGRVAPRRLINSCMR